MHVLGTLGPGGGCKRAEVVTVDGIWGMVGRGSALSTWDGKGQELWGLWGSSRTPCRTPPYILLITEKQICLHLPQRSQEEFVPRGVSPYFEVPESIFGLALTRFHSFTSVVRNQRKTVLKYKVGRAKQHEIPCHATNGIYGMASHTLWVSDAMPRGNNHPLGPLVAQRGVGDVGAGMPERRRLRPWRQWCNTWH